MMLLSRDAGMPPPDENPPWKLPCLPPEQCIPLPNIAAEIAKQIQVCFGDCGLRTETSYVCALNGDGPAVPQGGEGYVPDVVGWNDPDRNPFTGGNPDNPDQSGGDQGLPVLHGDDMVFVLGDVNAADPRLFPEVVLDTYPDFSLDPDYFPDRDLVVHDDLMGVSRQQEPPSSELACLDVSFLRAPPPANNSTQFFATTVDGPFPADPVPDQGTFMGALVGPVLSFSAGGKLWTLVPERRYEPLVRGCSPGRVTCVAPGDATQEEPCLEVKGLPEPLGNVCFTGACADGATSDGCHVDLTLGTPPAAPGIDWCAKDEDCAGGVCLPYMGCHRGSGCDAEHRDHCLPRLSPGTLGVVIPPNGRLPFNCAADPTGTITNCIRRAIDGVDTAPGKLDEVTRPYERWIATASAIDPAGAPFPDAKQVLVWGRENFLAARSGDADDDPATPVVTDWKPIDLYLWSYVVFDSGFITGPSYWCDSCPGGFTSDMNAAVPVLEERSHVIANQTSIFWADPIQRWVMIYGGRIPFVETKKTPSPLPSLSPAQVFDPTAGIYMRTAQAPQGPWSPPRTIYNPFGEETFGYCEIMYFADAYRFLREKYQAFFDQLDADCPTGMDAVATRTAQAWWNDLTVTMLDRRLAYGAEYGAAVLPKFIESTPDGDGMRFQWLLSTWNPYRVVVMQTDVHLRP
jgi:hypothetical protein